MALALILPVHRLRQPSRPLKAQFFPGRGPRPVLRPRGRHAARRQRACPPTHGAWPRQIEADPCRRVTSGIDGVIDWVIGRKSAPNFYYNIDDRPATAESSFAEALITHRLRRRPRRRILPEPAADPGQAIAARRRGSPVRGLVQGPPVKAPVEIRVFGPDIAGAEATIGEQVRASSWRLRMPEVLQARTSADRRRTQAPAGSWTKPKARRLSGLRTRRRSRAQLEATLEGIARRRR